jgi:hypothetical protein
MTWSLSQSATSFSGTLTLTDNGTGTKATGTVSGSVCWQQHHVFAVRAARRRWTARYTSCSATLLARATVSGSSLSGSYAGSNSCSGTVSTGTVTLSKQ